MEEEKSEKESEGTYFFLLLWPAFNDWPRRRKKAANAAKFLNPQCVRRRQPISFLFTHCGLLSLFFLLGPDLITKKERELGTYISLAPTKEKEEKEGNL
jgi:hypothetical protein